MTENPNRGSWIIAGAILLAAVMVVAVLLFQRSKDDACKNWQAEVQEMLPSAFNDVNIAVLFVERDGVVRPDSCPLP